MWKRLNNAKGARQPVVADHGIYDGFFNEGGYGDLGYNRTQSPPDRIRPPPRPPRDIMRSERPGQPFEANAPQHPPPRDSSFRPVSSIYSQPSPKQPASRFPPNSYATQEPTYTEEVSPPSSPDFGALRHPNAEDDNVSPIDDMPDVSRLGFGRQRSNRPPSAHAASSIPVLRREKRRNQVAAAASNFVSRKGVGDSTKGRKTVDPRWDPYSGEITTSEKGKPQSVKPGEFTPPGLRSVRTAPLGNESHVTGLQKQPSSFGERVRKLKNHTALSERPEWKGATGRVALVSPVADQPDIKPLNIPRKSSKRVASPVSGSSTPVSVIRAGAGETDPASAQLSPQYIDPTIRTVFTDSGRNSPQVYHSPTSLTPEPPTALGSNLSQVRGDLPTEVRTHQKKDSAGTIERNFREALRDVSFAANPSDPYIQPPSRFSVTTYAPSEGRSSARQSTDTERPPMPTPPQSFTNRQSSPNTPILNRKRPKVPEEKATTRKAVNAASPVFISMKSSIAQKRVSNITKTLPQSPAEAESQDLITSLQAQLDNLAHRRNNITRSIRQMTELMPTDHVVLNAEVRRKREDEKRKVEGLREEEADVRRQEHDIGLRLHRAYKRKDKEAVYEPTGLWVRRVTG